MEKQETDAAPGPESADPAVTREGQISVAQDNGSSLPVLVQ